MDKVWPKPPVFERKEATKYTIGKYLRKKKNLRKADPTCKVVPTPEKLKRYIEFLEDKGASIKKVAFSEFKLKNGLPYYGLSATEKIISDEIMVKIPRDLLLTTKKAYFSEAKHIFQENPKFFSPYHTGSWEDRMLLVYLLIEHKKGEKSLYYHLLENLPRDLDYVVFWDDEKIKSLDDPVLFKLAKHHRKEYNEEEAEFLALAQKYPDVMDPQIFTKENIRWIYTHLVTRCFGKYFEYVTMVPFAELFNHECADVYYDLEYYKENPHTPDDYKMDDPVELKEGETDGFDTSDGSYESNDPEWDSDTDYEDEGLVDSQYYESLQTKKTTKDDSIVAGEINTRICTIENFVMNEYDWADGFSVFFVKELMDEVECIKNAYNNGKKSMNSCRVALKECETMMQQYKLEFRYYQLHYFSKKESDIVYKQKENLVKQAAKKDEEINGKKEVTATFDPDSEWKDDKFDNFVMKTSWKDQFEPGSQVYFCYGRLSNRMMLLRYGCALEHNKYEHVYMKMAYFKPLKSSTWMITKLQECRMSRFMRFKLKRMEMNSSFLNYFKGLSFSIKKHNPRDLAFPTDIDLEIRGLERMIDHLEKFLESFKISPEENKKTLMDPKSSYYDYFAAVYRLERQRVVKFHLKAYEVLLEILNRVSEGVDVVEAQNRVEDLETEQEYFRNRVFLEKYLKKLMENFKKKEKKGGHDDSDDDGKKK